MLGLIIQTKRRYKNIVKRQDENNEKGGNDDLGSTGDEGADGQSSITHNDQDSDVSFENGIDEEIVSTEIEEENCIEYITRSTDEAMEKMKNAKIRCWNKTRKKSEMETRAENNNITEREMVEESRRMEPWTPFKIQDQQSDWETKKKMGEDDINQFLKLEEDETENFIESSSQINKTWINTVKDRGRWTLSKTNTQ